MTLTSGEPELPDAPAEPWPRAAHLIGVAGAGMQSLAALLLERGCRVSGSDWNWPPEELVARGLTFTLGHAAEHVRPEADLVIYSAAVVEHNVERKQATRRGIPQVSYPEMLGRISAATPTLAVAGTHGKSTTCAMLVEIYRAAGLDPSHLYGATPIVPSAGQATSVSSTREHGLPGNGRAMFGGHAGRDALLIAEACEFRRHFWQLSPRAAAILAVEPDHFDCYPTPRDLLVGFAQAHDEIVTTDEGLRRTSGRSGGTEGGMTTGEVLRVRAAMKPIATVPRALRTVDVATGEAATAHHQRSDVCAVPAAGIVAEAMVALVLADAVLEKFGGDSVRETRRNAESYLDTLRFR